MRRPDLTPRPLKTHHRPAPTNPAAPVPLANQPTAMPPKSGRSLGVRLLHPDSPAADALKAEPNPDAEAEEEEGSKPKTVESWRKVISPRPEEKDASAIPERRGRSDEDSATMRIPREEMALQRMTRRGVRGPAKSASRSPALRGSRWNARAAADPSRVAHFPSNKVGPTDLDH